MAQTPYKYLTDSYVRWLNETVGELESGMRQFTRVAHTMGTCCFIPENAAKPKTPDLLIQRVVLLDGHVYIRQQDGLSWDREDVYRPIEVEDAPA